MAEHFDFQALPGRVPDHVQAALPGQHHPHAAQRPGKAHAADIVQGHLGTGMHRQIRKARAEHIRHGQVLHQYAVHPQAVEQRQHLPHLRQLPILDEGVHGHMDAHPVQVAVVHGLGQLGAVEVPRPRPGR